MAAETGVGADGTSTNPVRVLEPRTSPVSGLMGMARLLRLQNLLHCIKDSFRQILK